MDPRLPSGAQDAPPSAPPSDAPGPTPRVLARHLARIDGGDDWGHLFLEVSERLPDGRREVVRSLGWRASWARTYRFGVGDANSVMELAQHRFAVDGRLFRVRALPEWERPDAVQALRLPPAAAFTWPDAPLPTLLALFADAPPRRDTSGPQDTRP